MSESLPLSRRQFIETGTLAAAGLLLARPTYGKNPTAPAPTLANFLKAFPNPPRSFQPKFRWWWPHGLVDPKQIRREIDAMADAGFGGAEIADVHHSIRSGLSHDTHGWGSKPWQYAVETALDQARRRGMTIDHSIGPSWPAASPRITPDSPGAVKELATARLVLEPGQSIASPIPPPESAPSPSVKVQQLFALQAIRMADEALSATTNLHGESLIDLLPLVQDNEISWTPPSPGRWLVISYWLRGSAQQPEGGPHTEPESFVVDHFSPEGTQAIIDLWEKQALTPRMRKLMRTVGGCLFEDSIEMETHETIWTPILADEFERRRGYSLIPYLPLLLQKREKHVHRFVDFDEGFVLHDWWLTFSELFLENHFQVLRKWAATLGLKMRGQPYGLRTDAIRAAAELDIPEGESLGFKNLDDYRSLAGGRNMGGRIILSNEAAAYHSSAYATTWKRVLGTLNPIFAAGVNQTVLHGFAYAEAPGATWPGFAAFTPYGGRQGYSEAWGPRQPSWIHAPDIALYFCRVHFLLQQGQPQVDIAVLRQKGYAGSGFGAPWFSTDGVPIGWTHEFISPATLELPAATIRGQRLAPDGPAYKALVFETDPFHRRLPNLANSTAQRLLDFAQKGLPIVALGDWSKASLSGLSSIDADQQLQTTLEALFALPNVAIAPERADIPAALERLGVKRDLTHPVAPLVHAQRHIGEHRFYYLCNASAKDAVNTEITLPKAPNHSIYQLNLWTGGIQQLPDSSSGIVSISLTPHQTAAFLVGPTLSTINSIAALTQPPSSSIELRNWTLSVEDWQPGDKQTVTRKFPRTLALDQLIPWSDIPSLADVSGIGTYRVRFAATALQATSPQAFLALDASFDTLRLRLNDKPLPPQDPLLSRFSLAGYLKTGDNTLDIEVSTTLLNRLRVTEPSVYGAAKRQPYGLAGAARIEFANPS